VSASEYVDVAPAAELAPGTVRVLEVGGREIVLCRAGDEYFALQSRCSHTNAPLARARIRGDCLVCPVHGARFRLRDGKHLTPPASSGLLTFPTRVENGRVQVSPAPLDPPGGVPDEWSPTT
jgi:3-phenylpropionate/trans-cinnamate dioxygenase ferredoxin subunit